MDTSKVYILMCEKAQEIQDLKEPYFHSTSYVVEKPWKDIPNPVSYYEFEIDCGERSFKNYIWIPCQDQLQDMMRKKYDLSNLIVEFYCFVSGRIPSTNEIINAGQLNNFNSLDQLWLGFVMEENFNKTWNDKEEIWENIQKKVFRLLIGMYILGNVLGCISVN